MSNNLDGLTSRRIHIPASQEHVESERHESEQYESGVKGLAELVRNISNNIDGNATRHLIGFFVIYSDEVVERAKAEIQSTYGRRVVQFPKTYLAGDEFTTFAGSVYRQYSSQDYSVDFKRDLAFFCTALCGASSATTRFEELSNAVAVLNRFQTVKELISTLKTVDYRDTKYIWYLEIDPVYVKEDLLANLSKMVNDDLIIVVNYLKTVEMEREALSSKWKALNYPNMGYHILQKYLGLDLIKTD